MPFNLKTIMFALLIMLCLIVTCSCTGADYAPQSVEPNQSGTAEQQSDKHVVLEPKPTPEPTKVLILADCDEQEADDFFRGASDALKAKHFIADSYSAPDGFSNYLTETRLSSYDGLIVLYTKEDSSFDDFSEVLSLGLKLAFTDMRPKKGDTSVLVNSPVSETYEIHESTQYEDAIPKGVAYARYENQDAATLALEVALSYPPHDTPVRLIALLNEGDSPAAKAFNKGIKDGKILPKAVYNSAESKQSVDDFLRKQLTRYVEGMIDAIYCENLELALAALKALNEQNRSDMEVFCVPDGALSKQRSNYDKWTFPAAMGADLYEAGTQAAEDIAAILEGKQPEHRTFAPSVVYPAATEDTQ